MDVNIPKGKYVVAVSGGVDSMTLLHLLAQQAKSPELRASSGKKALSSKLSAKDSTSLQLVVAHFNHGIRADSHQDEELVRRAAQNYQKPFEVGYGHLVPKASEEKARDARYKFLSQIKKKHSAKAIITAHHQDDLIETAMLNTLRGSGRRGLTAITDSQRVLRPLLHIPKKDIMAYAKKHNLAWREDPSNKNVEYLRNYIRLKLIPGLSKEQKAQYLEKLDKMASTNRTIDQEIANISQKIVKNNKINRPGFINLPTEIAKEVLMHFLRANNILGFDKPTIERLTTVIKTARPGTKHDVTKNITLLVASSEAHLATSD